MPATIESLAELLTRHRPERIRVGYPVWLRAQVGPFVREYREKGGTLASLAEALSICNTTLATWERKFGGDAAADGGGFAAVVVKAPVAVTVAEAVSIRNDDDIDLVTPDGFRLEGLSFAQSMHAVQALR